MLTDSIDKHEFNEAKLPIVSDLRAHELWNRADIAALNIREQRLSGKIPCEQIDFSQHGDIFQSSPVLASDSAGFPILIAENTAGALHHTAHQKSSPGEYVTVSTEHGKLNIPAGNPAFGLPTNFEEYSKHVNEYVRWIETWNNGKAFGWNKMNNAQKDDFANALRHALGIAYVVFEGVPGDIAVKKALGHEEGDASEDSKKDRNNNIWAARKAEEMLSHGKTWFDFVVTAVAESSRAAFKNHGYIR